MNRARPKIAFVVTTAGTIRAFMVPHLLKLVQWFDITLYSNFSDDPADDLRQLFDDMPISLQHIAFERKISLWRDLKSWWRLFWLLRSSRPSIVHSMMPKTGLVATTSGLVAGVPTRLHMFTGQVWATRSGLSRSFLKMLDKVTSLAATHVLADSPSQRSFLISNGFRKDIAVLGNGSVSGVDIQKFAANPEKGRQVRRRFGLDEKALVFGFLGRMNFDKGVADLVSAFAQAQLGQECHLLLVGPDEAGITAIVAALDPALRNRIHLAGYTNQPQDFLATFDVYCLPSYREGFGTSAIEAAACGIPALVSEVYGLTDAVEQGVSGLFHAPGDVSAIAAGLEKLAGDPALREKLGIGARHRTEDLFTERRLVDEMSSFYHSLVGIQRSN
jgi:glycosyltransferase involved in cell wall biosynthesis